ncbi:MAG: hypothetical protein MR270_08050, partial [Erysipelotrichaceae bacterium]|nr:hypothetical protein [Erysipelotrichaceae bacterium]
KKVVDEEFDDIKMIFNKCLEVKGIHQVEVIKNFVNRDNRFDLMIRIKMDESSLLEYDTCKGHSEWKEKYADKVELKAIFDEK